MIRAAGVLCVAPNGHVLLLRRTDGQGWAFPGGGIEDGESAVDAARRELLEETGVHFDGPLTGWTRRVKDEVDFTTFRADVESTFAPKLNDEHDEYVWIDRLTALDGSGSPAGNLHPGVRIALLRPDLDELGIAKAIREGELISPQRYGNLLLIALRVTGTGASYREKGDQFVWRDPSLYLNDEFLQRIQGLPVIFVHPPTDTLNTEEYRERVVGAVMLPYILEQEIWCIARINDGDAATALESHPALSTSPAVICGGNKYRMQDGSALLVEGKPALIDHLAVIDGEGVWDKGGEQSGVLNQLSEDPPMPDDNVAPVTPPAGGTHADAGAAPSHDEHGEKLDKILAHCESLHSKHDALSKRVDALEGGKGGPAEPAAAAPTPPAVRTDGREEQPGAESDHEALKKEREENALKVADAQKRATAAEEKANKLEAQIAEINKRMPVEMPEEDRQRFIEVQSRAERVAQAFGDSKGAPVSLNGETLEQYTRRLWNKYKPHSPTWKDIDLTKLDAGTLKVASEQIYADAMREATTPTTVQPGVLLPSVSTDETGRRVTRWRGDIEAAMAPFKQPVRFLTGLPQLNQQRH